MTDTQKNILFILRHAPYGQQLAREAVDAILTAAAFEQPMSVLFMDDGVFQLVNDQQPQGIVSKNLQAMTSVLPMYDVENIYVDEQALAQRSLHAKDDLYLPVQLADTAKIQALIAEHQTVLSF